MWITGPCERSRVQIPDEPRLSGWEHPKVSICSFAPNLEVGQHSPTNVPKGGPSTFLSDVSVTLTLCESLDCESLLWLVGLGVWFSLRVREVPGSTAGRALSFNSSVSKLFLSQNTSARALQCLFQKSPSNSRSFKVRARLLYVDLRWWWRGHQFRWGDIVCSFVKQPLWSSEAKCKWWCLELES